MPARDKKAKILIVEDESLVAADLATRLTSLGYHVCGDETTAEAAIALVEKQHPDLILMDIVLKGEMDGIDAAKEIHDKWGIPVVFLTAHGEEDKLKRAKQTNPFGYILKPFSDRDLKVTVEMALYVANVDAERRRTEEELVQTNLDLKLAQRIAKIGNWSLDPEVGTPVWSDLIYEIYERDPSAGPPSLEDYRKIYSDEHLDRFWSAIQSAIEHGTPYDIELHLQLPNLKSKWIHAICEPSPVKGPKGHLLRGTIQDITEQKISEKTLKESKTRLTEFNRLLAGILDHTHMMAVFLDTRFNFIWVNRAYADTCKLDPSFLLGKNHFELYPHEENQAIFQKVVDTGEPFFVEAKPFEFPDQPARGVTFWNWSLIPVKGKEGKVVGLVFTLAEVTERIRAEEELRKAYSTLKSLWNIASIKNLDIQKISDHILEWIKRITESQYGFYGFVNDDETVMTIHSWSAEAMKDCSIVGQPQHFPIDQAGVWAEAIRNRKPLLLNDYSKKHRAKTGWPEGHVPLKNLLVVPHVKNGKVTSVAAVANKQSGYEKNDINLIKNFLNNINVIEQRVLAEDELRLSEERYRQIFEANQAIKILVDPNDGKIVQANEAACQYYGYGKDEILAKKIFDINILHPGEVTQKMSLAMTKAQHVFNFKHRLSSGEIRDVEVFSGPISTKQGTLLYSIVHDITERKRAEEKLRDTEKVLSDILEGVLSGYWDWNIPANTEYYSPAFKKMFGYEDHELPNIPETWQKLIFPEDLPGVLEKYDRHIKSRGEEPYYNEIRYRHKNGSTIWVICAGRVIEWADDGSPIRMVGCHVDITNRKEAEEELKKYKQIVSSTKDAISYLDKNYRYQIVNDAYERFSGDKKEKLLGQKASEYIGEDIFEIEIKENYDKCLKGETVNYQKWIQFPTIGRKFVDVTYFPYRDSDGAINGIVANTRDITDRKRAEDELKESEERFGALVESAPVSIMLVRDGKYIYGNPASTKYLGYKNPEEIVGVEALNTIAPEFREAVLERMTRLDHGHDNAPMEMRIIRPDGSSIWSMSSSVQVKLHGKPTTIIVGQDITEQKRAKQALDESEARYRFLVETANEGIWYIDKEEKSIFVNQAMADILGYEPSEIIGKRIEDFTFPEDIPFHEEIMKTRREGGDDIYERRLRRKDGSSVLALVSAKALLDNQGRYNGSFAMYTDITERKRAENALAESESAMRGLLNAASDAAFMVDTDGVILVHNQELAERVVRREEQLVGRKIWDLLSSEVLDIRKAKFLEAIKTGEPQRFNDVREGRHIANTIYPVFGSKGNVTRLAVFGTDITDRKRAEEALRESEERYRALVDFSPLPFLVTQKEKIVFVNPAAESLLGAGKKEIVGTSPGDWLHPEFVEKTYQRRSQALETGATIDPAELRIIRRDGQEITVLASLTGIIHNGEPALLSVFQDVTERKKAEKERNRLITAIEQAGEVIVITNPRGDIQYVNPAFERITGYSSDVAIGQNPNILKSGRHDESFYEELWRTISAGETWTGKFVNKRKDGTCYTEEATISPVKDDNGAIVNYVAVKRDITDELEMENQLRQSQKMEAIGTLAGGIAHDFNNILAALTGYTELAIHSLEPDAAEKSYLDEVLKAGKRAKGLVNQILTFSRSSDENRKPIEIQPIIKETLKFLRASIPTYIELEQDILADPVVVFGDPTQLNQIVMNLCTNAAHAIGDNTGKIIVHLEQIVIDQDALDAAGLSPGNYVRLSVADTGQGMDQETLAKLFDPFFTTKKRGEGTGLGLSVVHGIVNSMEGKIHVDSEPGTGTTFSLYLPVIQKASEVESVASAPLEKGRESILVVDDEQVLVDLMRKMLEKLGYHVACRTCPLEALHLFQENPRRFDLVVTDQSMPNMTGLKLGEELMKIRSDLPIVLCTGFSETVDPNRAKAVGFQEFLMKPVLIRDLAQAIRRALDGASVE